MATGRPVVSIYQFDNPSERTGTLPMPHALTMPLRPDLVNYVHTNMSKNKRQAYAVGDKVGYDTAAESWGTGRAVARIPRAPGGGTHRAGQGAFGNMCRGGGMFSPTKIWRRWHRKINVQEKRTAVVSALSASCLPPLVMAKGHKIDEVAELPLVLSDGIESIQKTKQAIDILKKLGCNEELQRIIDSKKIRPGKGKRRNRRYKMKKGPMVIYKEDNGIVRAMRNIPGVETACVTHLNLLKLAPGGSIGRFLIWTESAFKYLQAMYGTLKSGAPMKKGFTLPKAAMENADIARIINSDEIQSVLRPKKTAPPTWAKKINPLKSMKAMALLNPHARQKRAAARRLLQEGTQEHKDMQAKKKKRKETRKAYNKKFKKGDETFYKTMMKAFETKPAQEEGEGDEGKDDEE